MIRQSRLLIITFMVTVVSAILVNLFIDKNSSNKWTPDEKHAIEMAEYWFRLVNTMKEDLGLSKPSYANFEYWGLLGSEFTLITTTLGNFDAKHTAANPEIAGLLYRWIVECKMGKEDYLGINLSGSFPSLAIASLAAAQTLGCNVIMISSLGASMYGANEMEATWIDIESYLIKRGGLKYKSKLLTLGGVNDNGGGIQEEGIESLRISVMRNNKQLFIPQNLEEAIQKREEIFLSESISVLINIGGNHASLGGCSHSPLFPNGLVKEYASCDHKKRGLLQRIAEKRIPIIHLLNIKELAIKNNLKLTPSKPAK